MPYPRFQRSRTHKFTTRTAGDLSITSTTFTAVDVALDITLEATYNDVLEIGLQAQWGAEAVVGRLRAVTVIGATLPTTAMLGDGTLGNPAWIGNASSTTGIGGSFMYAVKTADISNDLVQVRLEALVDTAVAKTLSASVATPLHFWARNIGPVDPN